MVKTEKIEEYLEVTSKFDASKRISELKDVFKKGPSLPVKMLLVAAMVAPEATQKAFLRELSNYDPAETKEVPAESSEGMMNPSQLNTRSTQIMRKVEKVLNSDTISPERKISHIYALILTVPIPE